jgi:hypothetical protein
MSTFRRASRTSSSCRRRSPSAISASIVFDATRRFLNIAPLPDRVHLPKRANADARTLVTFVRSRIALRGAAVAQLQVALLFANRSPHLGGGWDRPRPEFAWCTDTSVIGTIAYLPGRKWEVIFPLRRTDGDGGRGRCSWRMGTPAKTTYAQAQYIKGVGPIQARATPRCFPSRDRPPGSAPQALPPRSSALWIRTGRRHSRIIRSYASERSDEPCFTKKQRPSSQSDSDHSDRRFDSWAGTEEGAHRTNDLERHPQGLLTD